MDVEVVSSVDGLVQFLSEGMGLVTPLTGHCLVDLCSGAQAEKNAVDEAIAKLERLATSQGLEAEHISSLMQVILGDSIGSKLACNSSKSHDCHMFKIKVSIM